MPRKDFAKEIATPLEEVLVSDGEVRLDALSALLTRVVTQLSARQSKLPSKAVQNLVALLLLPWIPADLRLAAARDMAQSKNANLAPLLAEQALARLLLTAVAPDPSAVRSHRGAGDSVGGTRASYRRPSSTPPPTTRCQKASSIDSEQHLVSRVRRGDNAPVRVALSWPPGEHRDPLRIGASSTAKSCSLWPKDRKTASPDRSCYGTSSPLRRVVRRKARKNGGVDRPLIVSSGLPTKVHTVHNGYARQAVTDDGTVPAQAVPAMPLS
ncbi:MAG TPA: hypothetical protein VM925_28905 [Labilithrix sp.]|nr:hypothetical protein [Labilithrix sp.]